MSASCGSNGRAPIVVPARHVRRRVDWAKILVWLGSILGPWLVIILTVLVMIGWRP